MNKNKPKKTKLLVVAHPDDEAIFFGGMVQRHAGDFHIVCVTDGNADGRGQERKTEFENSCRALGCDSFEMWSFPDIYEKRLDLQKLSDKIRALGKFEEVYTHNPVGEYGHPHHQDVCRAVHHNFPEGSVHSPAYNNFPDTRIELTQEEYDTKAKILTTIYGKETRRFINILPISFSEGFSRANLEEVGSIHDFLTGKSSELKLNAFSHMEEFIRTKLKNQERLF